ncbi:hypothetical protein CWE12_04625 [Aliidiomarina sedimenti]|uniref:Uncharacterized protein n=1 Tax=Aliidiomarina sedimenti TaxID=1933879 RepID=A0ABY0BZM8_9GAMM|nr:hypothetical protein CWE12_04625 [Aliidiomarina sedimenti]
MFYLEVILLISFVVLMVVGYKKNNRNTMLAASLCLVVAVALPGFSDGFQNGFEETKASLG